MRRQATEDSKREKKRKLSGQENNACYTKKNKKKHLGEKEGEHGKTEPILMSVRVCVCVGGEGLFCGI